MSAHGTLHVTVLEARALQNLPGKIGGDFHVEMYCDQYHKQRTKVSSGLCPQWNETFTL